MRVCACVCEMFVWVGCVCVWFCVCVCVCVCERVLFCLKVSYTTMKCKNYKNTRLKLLKSNAVVWFNKMCQMKQMKRNYIQFETNGKTLQNRNTESNAITYRNNQEINFLYRKKRNVNTHLYRIHLQCADQCNSVSSI